MVDKPLDALHIQSNLSTEFLGRPLHYYDTVTSTNEVLREMAVGGAAAGTMVVADFQSQGRGRMGRRWQAPANSSLLVSLLFRPRWSSDRANWLTMLAGLAATDAICSLVDLPVRLKWPNDLVFISSEVEPEPAERHYRLSSGRWLRKVGGILLEGSFDDGYLDWAIVGLGLNVNIPAEALPDARIRSTSLMVENGGRPLSRSALLTGYLSAFERHYRRAVDGRSPQPKWSKRLITVGRIISVALPSARVQVEGMVEGTDDRGRLLVRDSAGVLHVITAGDVTLQS